MSFTEEAAQFQSPVHETGFTSEELEKFLSSLESDEPVSPNSGSEGLTRAVYSADERKQRRMISNRESARRSRFRKRMHLENITYEVNRLSIENQQLKDRLRLAIYQCHVARRENEQLRSESVNLGAKLLDLYWTLATMQSR